MAKYCIECNNEIVTHYESNFCSICANEFYGGVEENKEDDSE